MKLGVSTSFKNYQHKIAYLEGVKYVEIWYKDLINKTPDELAAFKYELDEAGIRVWSIHTPCGEGQELSELDEGLRFKAVAVQKSLLNIAQFMGASILVVHPGGKVPPSKRKKSQEQLLRSLKELLVEVEGTNIRLGLENLPPGNMGDHPDELLSIVEEISSPQLGITFDTGHAFLNGDLIETFRKLAPHVIHFHLSDNDKERDLHLPPGFGDIDWEEWFVQKEFLEWKDPIIMECEPHRSQTSYVEMTREFIELVY